MSLTWAGTVPGMTRTRHLLPALLAPLLLAGCGDSPAPAPAAPPSSSAAATSAPSATVAAPSPTVDPDTPLPLGKGKTTTDGSATATVYGYRHNVAKSAPRPDEQPGYVWGAADVKVCISKTWRGQRLGVSNQPWTLVYADDTQIGASDTGYEAFPEPEYPWTPKELAPGRCLRGWITFPVPGDKRPKFVEWAPEGEQVAPRWAVK